MKRWWRRGAIRITTIEGRRHITLGTGTLAEYAAERRRLITAGSKVGKSRWDAR